MGPEGPEGSGRARGATLNPQDDTTRARLGEASHPSTRCGARGSSRPRRTGLGSPLGRDLG